MTEPVNERARNAGVHVDFKGTDAAQQAAEALNNNAEDIKEDMQEQMENIVEETPKSPEEFIKKKGFNAWVAAEKIKEKTAEAEAQKDTDQRFRVDLDKYMDFSDDTCSDPSKIFSEYIDRLRTLNEEGCNIERLDTAAAGLTAEAGEFAEIVKKLKFQGKPWNEANKEHLIRELGDILWYAAQAAHALEITLDHAYYINSLKLAERYASGSFSIQESEHRKEGDL